VDHLKEIDLGDHRKVVRPVMASFVVVVGGAARFQELDVELQKVPYWDFIR
jgi:hypothetical protein